jgi:hypothetical protein
MSDWTTTSYPQADPREDAGWRPVGGAFVASAAVHAIAIATFAAILVREPAAATFRVEPMPLQALLVSPVRSQPEPVTVRAAKAPAPPRVPAVRAVPVQTPWSGQPFDREPPAWLYSRPMITEGVVMVETRNVAVLGERIERVIVERYPREPQFPVVLKPAETLGYPLDVLEAGVEGKVFVWFGVDEEGKVVDREALDGPPELSAWVLERLDRLVDRPAHDGDDPVRGWVALEVEFSRDAAQAARDIRAAQEERLHRAEERARGRAGSSAADPTAAESR